MLFAHCPTLALLAYGSMMIGIPAMLVACLILAAFRLHKACFWVFAVSTVVFGSIILFAVLEYGW